jgi:hypothetical protein
LPAPLQWSNCSPRSASANGSGISPVFWVAAGIGLLIFRYAFYAAVLLAIVMVGGNIAHLIIVNSSPAAPVVLFVLTGIIAYLRRP